MKRPFSGDDSRPTGKKKKTRRRCDSCPEDKPTRPTFGMPGAKPSRCKDHALPGMIDVVSKRCDTCPEDKPTQPVFGMPGAKPSRCKDHKLPGMINVKSKRCDMCPKHPAFGMPGAKPSRCKDHALPGMIDVKSKRCDMCPKHPAFGMPGAKPSRCKDHKLPGMSNVKSKQCDMCPTRPAFGMPGAKPSRCKDHALPGMIDVVHKRCDMCPTHPAFGMPGAKPSRCKDHALPGMIDVKSKRCESECCTPFSYEIRPITHLRHPETKRSMCQSAARNMVIESLIGGDQEAADRLKRHFRFKSDLIVRQEHVIYHYINHSVRELRTLFRCLDTSVKSGLAGKAKSMNDFKPDSFHKLPSTNMALHLEIDETPDHEDSMERLIEIATQADTFGRTYVIRIQCNMGSSHALCKRFVKSGNAYYNLTSHGESIMARVVNRVRQTIAWMKEGLVPNEKQGRPHVVRF